MDHLITNSGNTLTFHEVDSAQLDKLREIAKNHGIILKGEKGSTTAHGVQVDYVYSGADHTLALVIAKKPFYLPMSAVLGTLQNTIVPALA